MRVRAPAPAGADAYVAPFRESGEPRAVAGQVVHRVWLCACTADCPRGHSWLPPGWRPCSPPCSLRPRWRPELPSPVQIGTGFALQSGRASPCVELGAARPQIESPGTLGEEAWETWEGSCGELMPPADF